MRNYRAGVRVPAGQLVKGSVVTKVVVTVKTKVDDITTRAVPSIKLTQLTTTIMFPMKLVVIVLVKTRLFANSYLITVDMFSNGRGVEGYTGLLLFICLKGFIKTTLATLFVSVDKR